MKKINLHPLCKVSLLWMIFFSYSLAVLASFGPRKEKELINYCNSYSNFPWEDWIAKVEIADLNNSSGKSTYSDFTGKIANVTADQSYAIKMTTGFSYFTWDEYWTVWIDFNRDGMFSSPNEVVQRQKLTAPPAGTPQSSISGSVYIPSWVPAGQTRMRVSMKRGGFSTSCEILPFGEVEDYTINIHAPANMADLELNATGNPVAVGSGTVHYSLTVTNKGPANASAISVKHYKSGNFANYSNITTTSGSFDPSSGTWSLSALAANGGATLSFDGLIVDMVSPQVDFFEILSANPDDPDSTPGNDNGAKTPDEDDEAAILLYPDNPANLTIADLDLQSSALAGSHVDYSFNVNNSGGLPAFGFKVGAYFSDDNLLSPDDILLGSVAPGTVPPNGFITTSASFTVPPSTPAGNYYVIIVADHQNQVFESNENDNTVVAGFEVAGSSTDYCTSYSNFPWEEWISNVKISNINHSSGKSSYSDFTDQVIHVVPDQSYTIELTSAFSYFTWDEYWTVWIDFNRDGFFSSPNEVVQRRIATAPAPGTPTSTVTGSVHIPAWAPSGATRMRVSMKRGDYSTSCEILPFGEVEDYTVNIGVAPCSIDYSVSNITCHDNGSPYDLSDDQFSFDILANASNGGSQWTLNWNAGSITGDYGMAKTIGPLSIHDFSNGFYFVIADKDDLSCSAVGNITPPAPCSIAVACGFSKTYPLTSSGFRGISATQTQDGFEITGVKPLITGGTTFATLGTNEEGTLNDVLVQDISNPAGYQVIRLRDGNFLFLSITHDRKIALEKKAASGVSIWSENYSIANAEAISPGNVMETPDGTILVAGGVDFTSTTGPVFQLFTLKTDADGNQQWLTTSAVNTLPGSFNVKMFRPRPGGNYLMTFSLPNEDKYLCKMSSNGVFQWEKLITGPLNYIADASENSDGTILASYVITAFHGPSYDHVVFARLSSLGVVDWERSEGNILGVLPNPLYIDYANPYMAPAPSGAFVVVFTGPGGLYFAELAGNGAVQWTKNHNLSPSISFMDRTGDGGYLLTGQMNNEVWLMKTDNKGEICVVPQPGDYCDSYSSFPWHEWIAGVHLNTLDNASGKSEYSDFSGISTTLQTGVNYNLSLTTGFSWETYEEYWKVWIDFNQDGIFSEPQELIFQKKLDKPATGTLSAIVNGTVVIPATALTGTTKMRVSMKRNDYPGPCEVLPYGEVEDYNVVITANALTGNRTPATRLVAVPDLAGINLFGTYTFPEDVEEVAVEKSVDGIVFEPLFTFRDGINGYFQVADPEPVTGINYYRTKLLLENESELFGTVQKAYFEPAPAFTLFPNPATDFVNIDIEELIGKQVIISLVDSRGILLERIVIDRVESSVVEIPLIDITPGIHFIWLEPEGRKAISKLLIVKKDY